jgi:hypothetical protein
VQALKGLFGGTFKVVNASIDDSGLFLQLLAHGGSGI